MKHRKSLVIEWLELLRIYVISHQNQTTVTDQNGDMQFIQGHFPSFRSLFPFARAVIPSLIATERDAEVAEDSNRVSFNVCALHGDMAIVSAFAMTL